MFETRSFLNSVAKILMMMLSVITSAVSWTTSHQNIGAQNQRNSTHSFSSLCTINTASSDKPFNTFKKLINSVCSVVSTHKAHLVESNRLLTYVDPYNGTAMQHPSNYDYEEFQAFAVCLLSLKSEGNANGH